eukprot:jgi/Ulvmu1/3667/UM017_0081.1
MKVTVKGGVWRNAEDEILKAAVMKYGLNQWARISSLLNRKSAKQCKARWYEWLDPSIKKTEWTREEDEKLLHLAKVMPTQWRTIAPLVGRTAQQCLERYERLLDQVMHKDGEYDPSDDPRRLRAGDIDPNPESRPARPDPVDMDEDEKEMLAEARARLANTRGKKAKRKAREAQLEEARRLATLQKKRELKAAGLEINKKAKRYRGLDYNKEVPFELGVPQGPYDTTDEAAAAKEMAGEFRPMTIEEMEGKRRRDVEAQAVKEDIKRHQQRLETDLPAVLAEREAAAAANAGPTRRFKMMLPQPALNDAEYMSVVDGMKRGGAVDAELATPATAVMASDYGATPAVGSVRTPMVSEGRVAIEARAAAAAAQLSNPLLGGQGAAVSMTDTDYEAPTGADVASTPNPLAAAAAAAAAGAAGAVGAAPGPSGVAATPGATPVRDALGINTPGGSTPLTSRKAEKARLAAMREGLQSGLKGLPQPHNQYALAGGAAGEVAEGDAEEIAEEDAADALARQQAAAEAARRAALARRSAAMRRQLPRPSKAPVAAAAPSTAAAAALQAAEALLAAEVAACVAHDVQRYPCSGKTAKKRRRREDGLLDSGPSEFEARVGELELAEAAGEIDAVAEMLRDKYGHHNTSPDEIAALLQAADAEHVEDPQGAGLVKEAGLPAASRIELDKARHSRCYAAMTTAFESSKPLAEKYRALIQGYAMRDAQKGDAFKKLLVTLEQKEIDLECFEELERREQQAIPRRVEELERLVAAQRRQEAALQERFKELKRRQQGGATGQNNGAAKGAVNGVEIVLGSEPMEA